MEFLHDKKIFLQLLNLATETHLLTGKGEKKNNSPSTPLQFTNGWNLEHRPFFYKGNPESETS